MSTSPINSTNAIDAAAFVILFNRPFTEAEETQLLALKELLKDDLPDFSRTTKVTFRQEAGKPPEHIVKESGLRLQKFEPNGRVGWSLKILDNQIAITCFNYSRWNKVWTQTESYIQSITKILKLESFSIEACILQYVDKFIEGTASNYNIYDVFNKNSTYLTAKAASSNKLWHVHQGWFDKKSADEKILNVLNLGTNEEERKVITTIDHALHLQFSDKPKSAKKFLGDKKEKEFAKTFLYLHECNKEVIRSLLNEKQRKVIGLV